MRFCELMLDGRTQAKAYEEAYDAENMKVHTIRKRANELWLQPHVMRHMAEARAGLAVTSSWTRLRAVEVLVDVIEHGGHTARINSVRELNAMHGFNEPLKLDIAGGIGHSINVVFGRRDV